MTLPVPDANTLTVLRIRIGLDGADTSMDASLSMAYGITVEWMENYLDRILYSATGTESEVFTHVHAHVLSLRGYPVLTITDITATDGSPVQNYHLEARNGLLRFDSIYHTHELNVTYTMTDPISGALFMVMLSVFDLVWATYTKTVDSVDSGLVKAISSDGARVEFDVSAQNFGLGGIDISSGLPMSVIGILNGFRRHQC